MIKRPSFLHKVERTEYLNYLKITQMAAFLKAKKTVSNIPTKSSTHTHANEIFTEFALEGLKIHNSYRKKHGAPELKLTVSMCKLASDWAKNLAQKGSLGSRQGTELGENLLEIESDSKNKDYVPEASDAIKKWYDEIKDYKFGTEGSNTTRHFTQLIWKGSTDLGYAVAKNKKGKFYVVANYRPKGNIAGKFVENVSKPVS